MARAQRPGGESQLGCEMGRPLPQRHHRPAAPSCSFSVCVTGDRLCVPRRLPAPDAGGELAGEPSPRGRGRVHCGLRAEGSWPSQRRSPAWVCRSAVRPRCPRAGAALSLVLPPPPPAPAGRSLARVPAGQRDRLPGAECFPWQCRHRRESRRAGHGCSLRVPPDRAVPSLAPSADPTAGGDGPAAPGTDGLRPWLRPSSPVLSWARTSLPQPPGVLRWRGRVSSSRLSIRGRQVPCWARGS